MKTTTRKRLMGTSLAIGLVGLASMLWNGYKFYSASSETDRLISSSQELSKLAQLERDRWPLLAMRPTGVKLYEDEKNQGEPSVYVQRGKEAIKEATQKSREAIQKQLEDLSDEINKISSDNKGKVDERNKYLGKELSYLLKASYSFILMGGAGACYALTRNCLAGKKETGGQDEN